MSDLQALLDSIGVRMTAVHVALVDDKTWKHDAWRCTIEFDGNVLATPFRMGIGHHGAAPTTADVLSALAADAISADQSFEDWCSDLGYDSDSRKAYRMYEACTYTRVEMLRVFGRDLLQKIAEAEH